MSASASDPEEKKMAFAPRKLHHHYIVLLVTELILILGFPFLAGNARAVEISRLLAVVVFAAALYAFLGRGRLTLIAFALGVPAVFIHVANFLGYFAPAANPCHGSGSSVPDFRDQRLHHWYRVHAYASRWTRWRERCRLISW